MKRLLFLPLLLMGSLAGYVRHSQSNSNCEWPEETVAVVLDPSQPSRQRHLSEDAEFGEDLAIRYADAHRGPRSDHFQGMGEYGQTRDHCMTALFTTIGRSHGVTEERVRLSLGNRRTSVDLAIMLSFVLLFGFCANIVVGAIIRRYPAGDGWTEPVVMTTFTAITGSVSAVLAGDEWCAIIEGLRLGSGHLSYRGERIPWTHHHFGLFLGGVILVAFISSGQYYRASARR